jgi:hypothetical protein
MQSINQSIKQSSEVIMRPYLTFMSCWTLNQSIEDTLYKDVMAASEWEATQKQLEEEVLRQSALEANVLLLPADDHAAASSAVPVDREGDFFMGDEANLELGAFAGAVQDDEDAQLAAVLRQSELEYWQSLS